MLSCFSFDLNRGGPSSSSGKKPDLISRVKDELSSATNIMRDNLGKVLDRGERLEDLEAKSGNLVDSLFILFITTANQYLNLLFVRTFLVREPVFDELFYIQGNLRKLL